MPTVPPPGPPHAPRRVPLVRRPAAAALVLAAGPSPAALQERDPADAATLEEPGPAPPAPGLVLATPRFGFRAAVGRLVAALAG
ncbi:MAG TPA: hypothetical protein VIC56_05945 [Gemmatimonadota bacterium]